MAKLKDGFYKQTAEAISSDLYVLLAGGGMKPLADFANTSSVDYAAKAGDSDKLGGLPASSYLKVQSLSDSSSKLLSDKVWSAGTTNKGDDSTQSECPTYYGMYLSLQYDTTKNQGYQFYGNTYTSTPTLYVRNRCAGNSHTSYNAWKQIAFISDIPTSLPANGGTADKANALTTARKIWGQLFDGSADVSGALTGVSGITFTSNGTTYGSYGNPQLGANAQDWTVYSKDSVALLQVKPNGNVLIGTTGDNGAKLQVNGSILNNTTKNNYKVNHSVYYTGVHSYVSDMANGEQVDFGVGKAYTTKQMAYFGYRRGSSDDDSYLTMGLYAVDNVLNIRASGNVLIGTTTDNGAKLQVNGNALLKETTIDAGYVTAHTPSTSGWYTVARVSGYFNFDIYISGGWNHGTPSIIRANICNINGTSYIMQLAGYAGGHCSAIRLGKISTDTYDVQMYIYAQSGSIGTQVCSFIGYGGLTTYTTSTVSTTTYSVVNELAFKTLSGRYYTETEADNRYLKLSGGILNGALNLGQYDLIFQGSDTGDIVWNSTDGREVARIYNNNGVLSLRHNAGATYALIHSGNIGSQSVNYATSAGNATSATNARYVIADNNAQSPGYALLQSGSGRADASPSGDTWIYWDTLGGTASPWGIKHEQAANLISFYGAGTKTISLDLQSGHIDTIGLLKITRSGNTTTIGSQNGSYCHYETTAPQHWFNKTVRVQGDVYGGSSYNRRLAYCDEIYAYALPYNGWWNSGSGQNVNNANGMTFVYGDHGSPNGWGILCTFDYTYNSGYKFQLFAEGYSAAGMYYRCRSADRGGWTGWKTVIDSGNINSQSVNYANSAGYATSAGSTTTCSYPAGFTSRGTNDWSGVAGTLATDWSVNGADIMFKYDGSKLNVITDGRFYQGIDIYGASKRVLDEYDINNTTWGYASSAGSAGSCSGNANGLASTGYGNGNLTYCQTDGSFFGNSGWSHYIIANHGNGSNYYNFTIGLPFWGVPIYKRLEGGTGDGWHTFITSENISSQSVNYASSANYANSCGNADTVDGYHVSSLWRSDGGTWNPGANITLNAASNGHEWSFDIYRNGYSSCYWHVWDSSLGALLTVYPDSGNVTVLGRCTASGFYQSSDQTLKTNIQSIHNSDNIPQLKSFDWKSDGTHSYGLIAQELEEQGYSELVSNEGDHKTVNYSAALSLIVGKLQVKIKELEKEIEILKTKNNYGLE